MLIVEAEFDHSKNDCFGVAILSHGDEGIVYGVDKIVLIDALVAPFKGDRCKSLLGKPKIFIIQVSFFIYSGPLCNGPLSAMANLLLRPLLLG